MKKTKSYYRERYFYHKEMHTHYKQLFETSINEIKFWWLQKQHLEWILDEVDVLLEKWCKNTLIQKVIELWKKRAMLDVSIHYDLINK